MLISLFNVFSEGKFVYKIMKIMIILYLLESLEEIVGEICI